MNRLTLNAIIATIAVTGLATSVYLSKKPYAIYAAPADAAVSYAICKQVLKLEEKR